MAIHDLQKCVKDQGEKIAELQSSINNMLNTCRMRNGPSYTEMFLIVLVAGIMQALFLYLA